MQRRPLDARLEGPDGGGGRIAGRLAGVVHHLRVEPEHTAGLALLHDDLLTLRRHDPVVVGVPLEDVVGRHRHGGRPE